MKYILIALVLLLSGCTGGTVYLGSDNGTRVRTVETLEETMRSCPEGSIKFQSSASNGGVSWFTMRCDVDTKAVPK